MATRPKCQPFESYIDKLLKEISLRFRDQYKNQLESGFQAALTSEFKFDAIFNAVLKKVEAEAKNAKPAAPRSFKDTKKFMDTVEGSGLIEKKEWKDAKVSYFLQSFSLLENGPLSKSSLTYPESKRIQICLCTKSQLLTFQERREAKKADDIDDDEVERNKKNLFDKLRVSIKESFTVVNLYSEKNYLT